MSYEDAFAEAEEAVKRFKTRTGPDGLVVVEIAGREFPRDWFVRQAARMKSSGEI